MAQEEETVRILDVDLKGYDALRICGAVYSRELFEAWGKDGMPTGTHFMLGQRNDETFIVSEVTPDRTERIYDALARSPYDMCPCMHCGEPVICLPDGLPYCEKCAEREAIAEASSEDTRFKLGDSCTRCGFGLKTGADLERGLCVRCQSTQ